MPDGPLTSQLQHLQVGDSLYVGKTDRHADSRQPALWLQSLPAQLGQGFGAVHEHHPRSEYFENFDRIVLIHGVRYVSELGYRDYISRELAQHEHLGDVIRKS